MWTSVPFGISPYVRSLTIVVGRRRPEVTVRERITWRVGGFAASTSTAYVRRGAYWVRHRVPTTAGSPVRSRTAITAGDQRMWLCGSTVVRYTTSRGAATVSVSSIVTVV